MILGVVLVVASVGYHYRIPEKPPPVKGKEPFRYSKATNLLGLITIALLITFISSLIELAAKAATKVAVGRAREVEAIENLGVLPQFTGISLCVLFVATWVWCGRADNEEEKYWLG